ncbi:AbgT family transporter [Campylobacter estrildidarum]|uniref:Aminobenzoyl-glutamate transporter n=1 Tax=Campylobacter estrildidarum TaxID=2510189 RepID=A0A4U7BH47_9BACT|nr:AbgT family transporter [Campylobacter estrildidarum]TKX30699.1 aminobenzoyl-glutamate transporter [Campylobacter estrildidarum]
MNIFLKNIEKIGNKIPDVTILFFYAFLLVLIISFFLSFFDFDYFLIRSDGSSEQIIVKNFLSLGNFLELLSKMITNFINFPPLAITLVVALGIGIVEQSGFLRVALIKLSLIIPQKAVVPVVLVISVASHIIGDGAYVFLMPVVAMLFISARKHPVAGIATAFAGLAGGFSASFTPSVIDPIMQSFTEKAAHIIDPSVNINVLCNYFVSLAGTISVILFCWFVCEKIVEPYLKKYLPIDQNYEDFSKDCITQDENKGFVFAIATLIIMLVILVILAYPDESLLRGPHGSLSEKDAILMKGLVAFLFFFFAIPGFVFGKVSKKFQNLGQVMEAMSDALKPLINFMVFCFICGQFLYVFNESNLSKLLAVSGAELLKSLALPSGITIFGIIVFTGFLNLFVTSATSKWAVLAPIFVPMLMLLGIAPELTQAAFRVSDSAINVMTPLFPFYPLIIMYCRKYSSQTGVGTLCSIMIPYSIALMIALTLTLYLFWMLDIPLGFESSYNYIMKG